MSRCLFGMPFTICVLLCLCIWCFPELSKTFFFPFCTALISSINSHILWAATCFLDIFQNDYFDLSFGIMISLVAVMVSKLVYRILYFKARFATSGVEDTNKFLVLLIGHGEGDEVVSNLVPLSGFYHHIPISPCLPFQCLCSFAFWFGILTSCLTLCVCVRVCARVLFVCCDSHSGLNLTYSLTSHLTKTFTSTKTKNIHSCAPVSLIPVANPKLLHLLRTISCMG